MRGLELFHVGVGVTVALGLAQADAVDDRGLAERVGADLRDRGDTMAAVTLLIHG
jgi:hypothetical protein